MLFKTVSTGLKPVITYFKDDATGVCTYTWGPAAEKLATE